MELQAQTNDTEHGNKITVAFKCSPELKSSLCEKADRLGITLSSHLENIVASDSNKDAKINQLLTVIEDLKRKVAFYEHPFLQELFDRFKGQNISYYDREGGKYIVTINSIMDVYTVIINSFKIEK